MSFEVETTNRLLGAIRTAAGNSDVDWAEPPRPLSGGFWAQMWSIRLTGPASLTGELVARVMPDPAVAARETEVQTHLASTGYPTPPVRLAAPPGPDLDRAWMLMDYAPGAPLLSGLSGPSAIARLPRIARTLPDQLARHAAALHRVDPSPLSNHTDDAIDNLLQGLRQHTTDIDRPDLTRVADHLHRQRPPTSVQVICHGDLHPFNILTHRDGDTVLDWSAARVADPAYDAAFTRIVLGHPPLTAPTALQPIIAAVGRGLARRFTRTYNRHAHQPVDHDQLQWHTGLHALRIIAEVAAWRANDELDNRADHPFPTLAPALTPALEARTDTKITNP